MKNKLITIIGPTAAKKTTLAHRIAQKINGAIINADAFQVYKQLNAGVNKPPKQQMKEIDYYFIDNINYWDEWNISIFQKEFDAIYKKIISENKVPILCGGSHLYIDCILKGYDLTKTLDDSIQKEIEKWTNDDLYNYIFKYDKTSAQKICISNRKRLLRCVAILKMNNNLPKSETDYINNKPKYNSLVIMVNKDRETLYNDINNRFDQFVDQGWIDEVNKLILQYPDIVYSNAFKAIGYSEIANSILNMDKIDLDSIKKKTRHLAKRQLTWCNNKFLDKIIYDYQNGDFDNLLEKIINFYYD